MPVTENSNKALFILNTNSGVPPVNYIMSKDLERRKNDLICVKSLSIDHSEILIDEYLNNYKVFVAVGQLV